jgi:TIR domain
VTDVGKAVFLSYASQDAEAAKRICEALRAGGIEVWFDQSELRGLPANELLIFLCNLLPRWGFAELKAAGRARSRWAVALNSAFGTLRKRK